MAPYSSALAWKIPWTEEPGRLQSMGSRRVGHDLVTSLSLFTLIHWRRKWQPTPVFLTGESQGRECQILPHVTLGSPASSAPQPRPRQESSSRKEVLFSKNTGVGCHFLLQCMKVKSEREFTQSCLTLSDPMDCSLPGSSIHGIFQAKVLEWGAIAFSLYTLVLSNYI